MEDVWKFKKPGDRKTYRSHWKNSGQKFCRSEIKQQQTGTRDTAGLINGIAFEDKQTQGLGSLLGFRCGPGWRRKEVWFVNLGML